MYKPLRAKAWQELSACIKTDLSASALLLSYSLQLFRRQRQWDSVKSQHKHPLQKSTSCDLWLGYCLSSPQEAWVLHKYTNTKGSVSQEHKRTR